MDWERVDELEFEVEKLYPDGAWHWFTAGSTLREAQVRMVRWSFDYPAQYRIKHRTTGEIL